MAEITWLGDFDASVQSIEQYGHTFVKGVPTAVPDKDPHMGKFKANGMFHVKGDDKGPAEPVPSLEPEPVDPDEGTEVGALRLAIERRGGAWHHRSNAETLRGQLAKLPE